MITEQDIQKAFFGHLMEFYKYRYEYIPGTFKTERDALAKGGIIADGVVQFTKPDGSTFIGTFEATSLEKADEVKFQRNALYFLWDCIAFASLATAAILLFYYVYEPLELLRLGLAGVIGFFFISLLFTFSLWYFGMGGWRKYRYIYAIEQFKKYHADEQWVVLGQDVFLHNEDPYLVELRTQCTYQGFGLATVSEEGSVRVLATPSRLGVYGINRAEANWLTGSTAYAELRDTWLKFPEQAGPFTSLWNMIARPMEFLLFKPIQGIIKRLSGVKDTEFTRHMRSFAYQKASMLLGISLIILLFNQAIRQQKLNSDKEVDTLFSFRERTSRDDYSNPEDEPGYLKRDDLQITYGKGVPKQYPELRIEEHLGKNRIVSPSANAGITTRARQDGIETDATDTVQEINLSALREGNEEDPAPKIESPKTYHETESTRNTTTAKGVTNKPVSNNQDMCSLISGKIGWLVQDNYFATSEGAELRVKDLREVHIKCFMIKASCVDKSKLGHYVFLEALFPTEDAAIRHLQKAVEQLNKNKLHTGRTIVRALK